MDREKVIGHLNDCMEASRRDNTWVFVRKDIVEDALVLLKEQPKECKSCGTVFDIAYKAGKESIVRCKDCKFGEPWGVLIGCGTAKGFGITHKPDWFCADGERKSD